MNLRIPGSDLAWKSKARDFAERHLFPREVELERTGHLPAETLARVREALVGHGLNASTTARIVAARA